MIYYKKYCFLRLDSSRSHNFPAYMRGSRRGWQGVSTTPTPAGKLQAIGPESPGSILQYFRPSISCHLPLSSLFCLFLSGCLRQVLLYTYGPLFVSQECCTFSTSIYLTVCIFGYICQILFRDIGVAPITQLRMCVIKIVAFKEGHLMWQK